MTYTGYEGHTEEELVSLVRSQGGLNLELAKRLEALREEMDEVLTMVDGQAATIEELEEELNSLRKEIR